MRDRIPVYLTKEQIENILGAFAAVDQEFRCFGDPPDPEQDALEELLERCVYCSAVEGESSRCSRPLAHAGPHRLYFKDQNGLFNTAHPNNPSDATVYSDWDKT